MNRADLLVELEPAQPVEHPRGLRPIVARLVPGQPGVRFDHTPLADLVSLGFPEFSDLLFFRPLDDVTTGHNAVTGPLAEIIRSRGVRRVFFSEQPLWACIRKAAAGADCEIWFGGNLIPAAEFRPRLGPPALPPGAHWTAWRDAQP